MRSPDRGLAQLVLEQVRAVRGAIVLPPGLRVPPGIRTYVVDGELRASSHDVERWVRDFMRGPARPIRAKREWA